MQATVTGLACPYTYLGTWLAACSNWLAAFPTHAADNHLLVKLLSTTGYPPGRTIVR
jgi:hypothetical protein